MLKFVLSNIYIEFLIYLVGGIMGLDFIKSKEFLKEDYRPSEDETFMNEDHVKYFRSKLLDWKKSILSESKDTILSLIHI